MSTSNAPASEGRTWVVAQQHPAADDANPGSPDRPLRTISRAAELAMPGDTVLVHAGVYRERVAPARGGEPDRPITYAAAPGEHVAVRGSKRLTPPFAVVEGRGDVIAVPIPDDAFPAGINPFATGFAGYNNRVRPYSAETAGRHRNPNKPVHSMALVRGLVFVDGAPLTQALSPLDLLALPGTFFVPPEGGELRIHLPPDPAGRPPQQRLIEITARHRVFAPHRRRLGHIHVRGFIFEHAANNHPTPQLGMVSTRSGHHWVIEDCVIRHASTVGLDVGSEWGIKGTPEDDDQPEQPHEPDDVPYRAGFHLVRNNLIADNGLCGLLGIRTWQTRIVGNVFERNNRLAFRTWEVGALKVHLFFDGLVEGNLFRDNDCFGIWLDNQYKGSRVTRNVILNSHIAGINVELGLGPVLIDNNIIAYTRAGDGVYSHDASGVTLAHNLIYGNANFGVFFAVGTDRPAVDRRPVRSSNIAVLNNLILNNKAGAVSLPHAWDRATNNRSDHNLLMGAGATMDEATGVEPPRFLSNTSHQHVKADAIVNDLRAALQRAGRPVPPAEALLYSPAGPTLSLEEWRLLTGFDLASRTLVLYHEMLGSRVPDFTFRPDATIWRMDCPAVAGVDRDFLGRPMPDADRLPGPFQDVRAFETNRYILWPVRADGAALPPRPAKPAPDATGAPDEKKDFSSTGL